MPTRGPTEGPGCLPTEELVRGWSLRAAALWSVAPPAEQELCCSLLIVGAEPRGIRTPNLGFRLTAPDFEPRPIGRSPYSIGSGNSVEHYTALLDIGGLESLLMMRQFNVGKLAPADPLAAILGRRIARRPVPGVSPHLDTCVVRCNDIIWSTNAALLPPGTPPRPQVAEDWPTYDHPGPVQRGRLYELLVVLGRCRACRGRGALPSLAAVPERGSPERGSRALVGGRQSVR